MSYPGRWLLQAPKIWVLLLPGPIQGLHFLLVALVTKTSVGELTAMGLAVQHCPPIILRYHEVGKVFGVLHPIRLPDFHPIIRLVSNFVFLTHSLTPLVGWPHQYSAQLFTQYIYPPLRYGSTASRHYPFRGQIPPSPMHWVTSSTLPLQHISGFGTNVR